MIGTKLSQRYELLAELGRGGTAVVFRAFDPRLDREVAIKVIPAKQLDAPSVARFEREARLAARLDHPAIVPIFDYGRDGDHIYLVMPVLEGRTLHRRLVDKRLTLGQKLAVAARVAEALTHSIEQGVVHRDIKPENIMVGRLDEEIPRVWVMDFGLALGLGGGPRVTATGRLPGTLAYLSPEQVMSDPVDGRADVYALGVVLYEMLAGRPPFQGSPASVLYRIAHEEAPPVRGSEVPEGLATLVASCLDKAPSRRPTVASLATSLWNQARRAGLQGRLVGRRETLAPKSAIRGVEPAPPRRRSPGHPEPTLVGRRDELATLGERLDRALAGECQVVLVGGGRGLGKTRLLAEVERRARVQGVTVLQGRFEDDEEAFPYQGFCELLLDFFRQRERDPAPAPLPPLDDLAPALLDLFPALRELEELASLVPTETPTRGAPRRDRLEIFEVVAAALARLSQSGRAASGSDAVLASEDAVAGHQPQVLLLENLHATTGSVELLRYLSRRLGPTPTLVVGSFLDEGLDREHPLARLIRSRLDDPSTAVISLGPLSADAHRQLVFDLLGSPKVGDALCDRLYTASEGNPFFTLELVRSMRDSGEMRLDRGAWRLAGERWLAGGTLPESIQEVVERRLERLSSEDRELLSEASVLGVRFDLEDLEQLTTTPERVDPAIDHLTRAGLLDDDPRSRRDLLVFRSQVVRDVLYQRMPGRQRRRLHRQIAEALETRHRDALDRVSLALLRHYAAAGVVSKAVDYALRQGRRAVAAGTWDDAVRAVRTALALVDDPVATPLGPDEGEMRQILAIAFRALGRLEDAALEAARAFDLFDDLGASEAAAAVALEAAEIAWQGRRVDDTRHWVDRGLRVAARIPLQSPSPGGPGAPGALETLDPPRLVSGRGGQERPRPGQGLHVLAATLANLQGELESAREHLQAARREASEGPAAGPMGGVMVVALPNAVTTSDPVLLSTLEDLEVLSNIFETLLRNDDDGVLSPGLAIRWGWSEGRRRLDLELDPEARFSDGTPLVAEDVRASFARAAGREEAGAAEAGWQGLKVLRASWSGVPLRDIEVRGRHGVSLRLHEPFPLLPRLLSDAATAVTKPQPGGGLLGTGPFRLAGSDDVTVELVPNPHWRRRRARLDRLIFRHSLGSSALAETLRRGDADLVHDLPPEDLDELLRDPRFRARWHEVPLVETFFGLWHSAGPQAPHPAVRRVMAGVLRIDDSLWRNLGRFALGARGLIPPETLGHREVPGESLTQEAARELLVRAGVSTPVRIRVVLHPAFNRRFRALFESWRARWAAVDLEIEEVASGLPSYLERWANPDDIDLLIARWVPEVDDPDGYTRLLLHHQAGHLGHFLPDDRLDAPLERARAEADPAAREALYRQVEERLLQEHWVLPLFHGIGYRVAGERVLNLRTRRQAPFVDFARLALRPNAPEGPRSTSVGRIRLALPALASLDPVASDRIEVAEVVPTVFESLTRFGPGAEVVPWLAQRVEAEDGGRRFHFVLRRNVRFHDGRLLSTADVRYSLERLVRSQQIALAPWLPFRGVDALRQGAAESLAGITVHDERHLTLELESPQVSLPALLASPGAAIVPAGSQRFETDWRSGCVGTGPFRVTRFATGERLELTAHPGYWRRGLPRCERLVFELGWAPSDVAEAIVEGRLEVATNLRQGEVAPLIQGEGAALRHAVVPALSTYFVVLGGAGPLGDPTLRRTLAQALASRRPTRETLGRLGVPATGLFPPGLAAHAPASPVGRETRHDLAGRADLDGLTGMTLRGAVNTAYLDRYPELWKALQATFEGLGVTLQVTARGTEELVPALVDGELDLVIDRWFGDVPDPDTFARLFHGRFGPYHHLVTDSLLDRLIEAGQRESDPGPRRALYREIGGRLLREGWLVPLFHEQLHCFAHPGVRGLRLGLHFPAIAYDELSIDR